MSFVSYAQNFEDVMLMRALRDVSDGFYIDVGASYPQQDSVTCAFYARGWHGINVEPSPRTFALLRETRTRDINLQIGLGAASGVGAYHSIEDGEGLSTFDAAIAAQHRADGRRCETMQLPITTLAEICAAHAPRDIHFLKIDVEGGETQVLEGGDFERYRPWIVLVEATAPNSQEQTDRDWRVMLTGHGYREVWFDGLNRFYLAAEQAARAVHFAAPPNVFDDFTLARENAAWVAVAARDVNIFSLEAQLTDEKARGRELAAQLAAMTQRAGQLDLALRQEQAVVTALRAECEAQRATAMAAAAAAEVTQARLQADLTHSRGEITDMRSSRSWQMTAPIRLAKSRLAGLVRRA